MARALVKSDPKSLEIAISDIKAGNRPVSVPLTDRQPEYTDYQALGFVLLETVLRQMTPWEISFAASMISTSHPTARQRERAKSSSKCILAWISMRVLFRRLQLVTIMFQQRQGVKIGLTLILPHQQTVISG